MRIFFIFLLFLLPLNSAVVSEKRWSTGETFLTFLESMNLPSKIYYNQDSELQKLTEEIYSGVTYHISRNSSGDIEQILIPVNEELQLHIKRVGDEYELEATPISYFEKREAFMISISNSPYYDIIKATGDEKIAAVFVGAYKNSLNFRRDLRKGDRLVVVYKRKYRMGKRFGDPKLISSMIETRKKKNFIFLNEDGRYYDDSATAVEGFLLSKPVRNGRLSSRFTLRRFHPILKRYRAHLGIDYAARSGTPIMAAGSGKIVFAGRNRGYGKMVKISHGDGYTTLYAHMKSFRKGIRRGKYVKQGQIIGYVGSTGLSTGAHLHFGLYKRGRAINPSRLVRVATKKLKGKKRREFNELKKEYVTEIAFHIQKETEPIHLKEFSKFSLLYPKINIAQTEAKHEKN